MLVVKRSVCGGVGIWIFHGDREGEGEIVSDPYLIWCVLILAVAVANAFYCWGRISGLKEMMQDEKRRLVTIHQKSCKEKD